MYSFKQQFRRLGRLLVGELVVEEVVGQEVVEPAKKKTPLLVICQNRQKKT